MSRNIPKHLRLLVAERAAYRCEYCRIPELFLATNFHVDHIWSVKHAGLTLLQNLSYCCPHCNQNKGSDIGTFEDEQNENIVRFFNPRKEEWEDHFEIQNGEIIPKTKIGDATIKILEFNLPERVRLRKELTKAGIF